MNDGLCKCGCGTATPLATQTRNGNRKGQPTNYCPGHTRQYICGSPIERFWRKVDRKSANECWLWTGHVDKDGYGRFGITSGYSPPAHRWIYEYLNGPLPENHLACHSCDNRRCCNPAHIWKGTPKDNTQDAKKKARLCAGERHHWSGEKVVRAFGESHPNHVLTESQVREIRSIYAQGVLSQHKIGLIFGVEQTVISGIIRGTRWKHVI